MASTPSDSPGSGTENQPPEKSRWVANLNSRVICPDCRQNPPDLIEDNADTICGNCGLVLSQRNISYESEWRTFNSDEGKGDDPNRVGEADNELLTSTNTGTAIGGGANASKETRRLKRAQASQQDSKTDKALTAAYGIIDQWSEKAALTGKVRSTAKTYYKRIFETGQFKGKSLEMILATCLFLACRQHGVPRSFNEMFGLTNVSKKELGRSYKQLERFLASDSEQKNSKLEQEGLVGASSSAKFVASSSTRPDQLCIRYCNMLSLAYRVTTVAEALAKQIPTIKDLAGRSPLSSAGACTYFASHLFGVGKSTKEVSEVASVSDATIKGAYKFLYAERDRLIDPEWLGPQAQGLIGDAANLPTS